MKKLFKLQKHHIILINNFLLSSVVFNLINLNLNGISDLLRLFNLYIDFIIFFF